MVQDSHCLSGIATISYSVSVCRGTFGRDGMCSFFLDLHWTTSKCILSVGTHLLLNAIQGPWPSFFLYLLVCQTLCLYKLCWLQFFIYFQIIRHQAQFWLWSCVRYHPHLKSCSSWQLFLEVLQLFILNPFMMCFMDVAKSSQVYFLIRISCATKWTEICVVIFIS